MTNSLEISGCASNEVLRSVVSGCRGLKGLALGRLMDERDVDVPALLQLEGLEGKSDLMGHPRMQLTTTR